MRLRTLTALWKANIPSMVWVCVPLWVAPIILALDGTSPDWLPVALVILSLAAIMAIAEFANTYTDRAEDSVYFPSSPFVKGELTAGTARKAFNAENALLGGLIIGLAVATNRYAASACLLSAWVVALAYSMPPARFKETPLSPITFAVGMALQPLAAWLVIASPDAFIASFLVVLTLHSLGYGISQKMRKTYHALESGLIRVAEVGSVYDLPTVGLRMTVRSAIAFESISALAAFALVPVFWHLDMLTADLSIALPATALPVTLLSLYLRLKGPVENSQKCAFFMTIAWSLIGLILLAVALIGLLHWGYVVLVCLAFAAGTVLLTRAMHPFGLDAIAAPWKHL